MKYIFKICLIFSLLFVVTTAIQAEGAFESDLKNDFDNYLNIVAQAPGYNTNIDPNSAGVMTNIIAFIISLVGVIFLILVIWSGIQWMSSGGNEEKIGEAKKRMIRASVGLGITLCAFIISFTVYSFFFEQYLDTAGTTIGSPPGSQTTIACSSNVECEDRSPRIICDPSTNNCVECLTDNDCGVPSGAQGPGSRPDIPQGATYCHPDWHVCMLPNGTD